MPVIRHIEELRQPFFIEPGPDGPWLSPVVRCLHENKLRGKSIAFRSKFHFFRNAPPVTSISWIEIPYHAVSLIKKKAAERGRSLQAEA